MGTGGPGAGPSRAPAGRRRVIGSNTIPCRAWIDSYQQLWHYLGVGRQVLRFTAALEAVQAAAPRLAEWMLARPMKVLALEASWDKIVSTVQWIDSSARPGSYLRQIDVPGVDTKFIERHRGVLTELLDLQLAGDRIDDTWPRSDFAGRYRFRKKPDYVRLRVPGGGWHGFSEISMVIFGGGYAVSVLKSLQWLRDRELVYWGDIDTHGFTILSRLRQAFPYARSILMDRSTLLAHQSQWVTEPSPAGAGLEFLSADEADLYRDLVEDALGPSVRLEQERVSFAAIGHALRSL